MKRLPTLGELFCLLAQDLGLKTKDIETLRRRYDCEGEAFLTKVLPLLGKALDSSFRIGRFLCPSNFKCRKGTRLPCFMGSVFIRIFTADGVLRENACPVAVYVVRQFCFFAYKTELPYKGSLVDNVINRFISTERELSQLKIVDDAVLKVASLIAGEVFGDFSIDDIACKHGPGVTTNCDQSEKFEQELDRTLPVVDAYEDLFFFNLEDKLSWRPYRLPKKSHHDYFSDRNIARVILVPKDSRGPRLISCEPFENQFVQQGIFGYMRRKLEGSYSLELKDHDGEPLQTSAGSPYTNGYVNFTRQSVNRKLAKEASISQEYSTLDLKDASDRVHLDLVKALFRHAPALLAALLTARSTRTELPNGDVVTMSKFAPMGSATCFPVLSTCVYLLVLSSIIGRVGSLQEALGSVYVYGDDVIVKTEFAQMAMNVLERYGLMVNRDKSFVGARFAESCGFDAFDGNEVTPIRLRKWHSDISVKRMNPITAWVPSFIETAKHLSASGLSLTAERLYSCAEAQLGPLPYGSFGSSYLCRLTWRRSSIPEVNAYKAGIRWKRESDRQRHPLGVQLRAWKISAVEIHNAWTTWMGHAQRIWPILRGDSSETGLPEAGTFQLPRQVVLRRGHFDHYALT